ncbi:MAG: MBL fold metallo-hydrolase [Desulfurococcales archaeon]|jgi:glyoxylase-like metal-dependent hydrolase (beta-lactamase superfamily II)|nr:MBL fold metallo-hydrolase [Desulfurococcales archaeon]
METFPFIRYNEENRIENQLKQIGLRLEDIAAVVHSHLHFDHVGQTVVFKDLKTPLIVHKKEL